MDRNYTLEKVKTIHRVKQDIYDIYNQKRLIFKIRDHLPINMRKRWISQWKTSKQFDQTFYKRGNQNGQ